MSCSTDPRLLAGMASHLDRKQGHAAFITVTWPLHLRGIYNSTPSTPAGLHSATWHAGRQQRVTQAGLCLGATGQSTSAHPSPDCSASLHNSLLSQIQTASQLSDAQKPGDRRNCNSGMAACQAACRPERLRPECVKAMVWDVQGIQWQQWKLRTSAGACSSHRRAVCDPPRGVVGRRMARL